MKQKAAILTGIIAGLIFLGAAVQILRLTSQSRLLEKARELAETGEHQQAMIIYERLGDDKAAADCAALYSEEIYQEGMALLQSGSWAEAGQKFSVIPEYRDSQLFLAACSWQEALSRLDWEKLMQAHTAFMKLGNHSPCLEALEQIDPALYKHGEELAVNFDLAGACRIWEKLGDYQGSNLLARRCSQMLDWASTSKGSRLLTEENRYLKDKLENVYVCDLAYIVVPEKCDSSTHFFIYYPGGRDEEMSVDYLLYYMMNPSPNTLAVFMRHNGLDRMEEVTAQAVGILDRAAAECGIFPRDIVAAGSSLGAYPAMHSAVYAWENHALKTDCVLSLDAGSDWMEAELLLSQSQCLKTAELGTEFYLFESPWVGMNRDGICRMVNTGNKVTMVGCVYDDHVRISLDAMGMGVVDWAVGDRSKPCNPDIYSFVTLKPGDEDKWA